jgi:hypothetical protein
MDLLEVFSDRFEEGYLELLRARSRYLLDAPGNLHSKVL